jgi:ATP-dependent exoDNAse (exonuclease V) beta subunit
MAYLIPFDHRFGYEKLERIDTSTGRAYVSPNGVHVPSVTTILDKTKDKATLDAWVARVGQAEADRIKTEAAYVGTNMHATLESILEGTPLKFGTDWLAMRGHEMALKLANTYLRQVTKVYGSEINLHYQDQYAGTTDLVAQYRGRLAIVDFKQSIKPKRHEYITDYFHQLAAYAIAHDEMYGTEIDFGAVLVAVQDGTTQEFTTTGREFQEFKAGWMKRLDDYRKLRSL